MIVLWSLVCAALYPRQQPQDRLIRMTDISPQSYYQLAIVSGAVSGHSYAALPPELLAAEQSVARENPAAALTLNRSLCRNLLKEFTLADACWVFPEKFHFLYEQQLQRIENLLTDKPDSYFSFDNDPFRKDLAILRHRLIPCGAEFATPFSGISRSLIFKGGLQQAAKFMQVITRCRGIKPFLELHMHPHYTAAFNFEGWIETYENMADLLEANPSFLGVQSTSWFLDPALAEISPNLSYLREVPERCGATILYAGEDDYDNSGAFATSQTRRDLYKSGHYKPRLFTRIWPRKLLIQRIWQNL